MSELPTGAFSFAVAMGDPIGCSKAPAKAMKEIRRVLTPGGKLAATFDNRLAALDFYLERGDPREMEQFIADGKTHWLTSDAAEQFEIHTYTPGQVGKLLERNGFQLLDMIGKTVLPMRHHRHLLQESANRRQWLKIEKQLWRDPAAIGRASHIQIIAQVI
jgi:SAM-dependent methyltransferase